MKYRLREGVVLETICGTSILVATLEARKYCDYTRHLNQDASFIIEMVKAELSLEEMAEKTSTQYEISKNEALNIIMSFLSGMIEMNYIIEESEE